MSTALPFAASLTNKKSRPIDVGDPMPWGKHKGLPIEQIPRDYLVWSLKNMDSCNPQHERYWPEFTTILEGIVGSQPTSPRPATPTITLAGLLSILAARGIKLSVKERELIMDDPGGSGVTLPSEIVEAIQGHKTALKALVSLVERPAPGVGSAKVHWGADLRCRVKAWYGAMSRQFHPDSGGSNESQKAVNACYQSLIAILKEWEAA